MAPPHATWSNEAVPPWPPGWHVSVVEATGSTNADLLELAAKKAPDRTVLCARHQTAGRGRLDRTWDAPPGANLLVSFLFREVGSNPHRWTQRIAVAAALACERVAGVSPVLKWPNDLLVDDAKLAGVLAQGAGTPVIDHVVVGIGLNVRWAPPGAAFLGEHVRPLDVLASMLGVLDELPATIDALYRAKLNTIGRNVRVELSDAEVLGRAVDVDGDGRLVVLDDCGVTHRFDTGDVIHLRPR